MAITEHTQGEGATPRWLRLAPAIFLILWCGGFVFAKIGLLYTEPLTLLVLRFALVLALLAPVAIAMRPPLPKTAAAWGHLAVIGVLMQAIYFGMCYLAFSFGMSAGGLALIVSMQPILVGLLAPSIVGEAVNRNRWIGLVFGLAGAAMVILSREAVGEDALLPVLCTVLALLGITAATLYEKRFGVAQHPVSSNLIQYAVGFAVTLPLAMLFETMTVVWSPGLIGALLYLTIANSLISVTLLLTMIRHGEASRVSALFFLVPPGAALIAWVFIGEALPLLAWIGMGTAALGVALAGHVGARARRI